jgi:hypothetical protein
VISRTIWAGVGHLMPAMELSILINAKTFDSDRRALEP